MPHAPPFMRLDPTLTNAHAAAALCAMRTGRPGLAAWHYGRAAALGPASDELRVKQRFAEARARGAAGPDG